MAKRKRPRRRKPSGFPLVSLAPPLAAIWGWRSMHEAGSADGLMILVILGLLVGAMMPAVLLSFEDLPQILTPARTRASYRYKRKYEDHWYMRQRTREQQRSSKIPKYLWNAIVRIDGHKCVWCGSREDLDVDHIWPWMAGGLSVFWNLMTLCSECNTIKLDYCPAPWYRPRCSPKNIAQAHAIYRHERMRRLSPVRWIRAGFALAA